MKKVDKYKVYTFICIVLCSSVNVIVSYFSVTRGLPLYLDTIGTILISMMGGYFPGIITAVATNLTCSIFMEDSVYFAAIGVVIAIIVAFFSRNERYKKKINILFLIIELAVVAGVLGITFQLLLLGQSQFDYVTETATIMAGGNKYLYYWFLILIVVALNLVDKTISVIIAIAIYNLIPVEFKNGIWNSSWKQRPLSKSETSNINSYEMQNKLSFRTKITLMLVTVSIALTIVFSMVSIRIIYQTALQEGKELVLDTTGFIINSIDTSNFKKYLNDREKVSEYDDQGYQLINGLLLQLKNSYSDLTYLYIYKIEEDACYIVFDTDPEFQETGYIGERIEFDEQFLDHKEKLLKGEKIGVLEVDSQYGKFVTAYEPLNDEKGNSTTYYVGADIAIEHYSEYIRAYIIKIALIFSGFFILILTYGLYMTAYNFVYPIGSLEKSIDAIMKSMDNQDGLEKNVKQLQKLDIRTNDEIEKLYRAFCLMTTETAEQMRNALSLTNSNKKMQSGLIITMADIMAGRGLDSKTHFQRMSAYVRLLLMELKRRGYYAEKLSDKYIYDVETSAPLYDIGKINIPESILNKHGRLTQQETEIMKSHTDAGRKILENAISTVEGENYLKEARNMAAYHHERWDGDGYPDGLHGEVIPLSARIIAVADTFEDLTTSYDDEEPISIDDAMDILRKESGKKLDPKCVEVFVENQTKVSKILRKYQET